jgi:hypothetical protein
MTDCTVVWLVPPFGQGEPEAFEATPEVLVPAMNAGWTQCEPPATDEEETDDVR